MPRGERYFVIVRRMEDVISNNGSQMAIYRSLPNVHADAVGLLSRRIGALLLVRLLALIFCFLLTHCHD